MSTVEKTLIAGDDVAPDIPVDDPTTIAPDEGDVGSAPKPGTFAPVAAPKVASQAISAPQSAQERSAAVHAAVVALNNRGAVHYTQGPRRWDGINRGLIAAAGHFPNYADCSSFATWCLWNGMRLHHLPDTVNGQSWHAGYTGTLLTHGTRVTEHDALPGDLALYGSGAPGKHVAICIGGGLVISHGSEDGPFKLALHYRKDLMEIRRYIGTSPVPPVTPRSIKAQQQAVDGLGYKPALVADGKAGPKTVAGIKWLQKTVGAGVDGKWGPQTEAKYVAYVKTH
jgi:cell wall-associated NlpC family hydrolase